ncbi:MAG: response regulator [Candidatus Omnitrophica bacterium]|nr:response regulator [Candidatus Omnitrophota bacterium]
MNKKILIVDDDEDLHTLYGLYLQSESFQIVRAYNGKQALEMVEKENPDLIVLDMIMPVMDGEEFFTRLCTEKKGLNIPVIIASVNEKIPPKLFELGNIVTTLKKPFTIETLVGKIQEALAKKVS